MSEGTYRRAIQMLYEHGIEVDDPISFPAGSIEELEIRLGHPIPHTYKIMLEEYGSLEFEGIEIYGLTRNGVDGKAIPNVVFATENSRHRREITDKMVRIRDSGYGPFFVIDCANIKEGAPAPVLEVSEGGIESGAKLVAMDFAEFLLGEVGLVI